MEDGFTSLIIPLRAKADPGGTPGIFAPGFPSKWAAIHLELPSNIYLYSLNLQDGPRYSFASHFRFTCMA
jgi:hypothetical protein